MPIIIEKKEDTDKTVAEDNQEDLKKRVEELEHENLLLHAELDYRKKLEALVEKRRKSERAKGRRRRLSPPRRKIQRKSEAL